MESHKVALFLVIFSVSVINCIAQNKDISSFGGRIIPLTENDDSEFYSPSNTRHYPSLDQELLQMVEDEIDLLSLWRNLKENENRSLPVFKDVLKLKLSKLDNFHNRDTTRNIEAIIDEDENLRTDQASKYINKPYKSLHANGDATTSRNEQKQIFTKTTETKYKTKAELPVEGKPNATEPEILTTDKRNMDVTVPCELDIIYIDVKFTERFDYDTGSYLLECSGNVPLNKCEGLCSSSVTPSVNHYDGYQKECSCCKDTSVTRRAITLTTCDKDGLPVDGYSLTRDIVEPAACACEACGN